MATFTLDDLKNEVSKKYAPIVIQNGTDEYVLQNLLQLPEKKRDAILSVMDNKTEIEEDSDTLNDDVTMFKEIIVLAEKDDRGQELLDLLGDNFALIVELANKWLETSQPGEAVLSSV